MAKQKIEVCYSPALIPYYKNPDAVVVVADVLRASSAIVTAFMNGVERIIPVGTLEEARDYKKRGYMVAAERDGLVRDFADFGNSPFNFTAERVGGKQIVYSTTNGTNAIQLASSGSQIFIALDDLPGMEEFFTIFGYVTDGFEVAEALTVEDQIIRITVESK